MTKIPNSALILGWAGVLPFAVLSMTVFFNPAGLAAQSESILIAYGACILSFMGGVHWGIAMMRSAENKQAIETQHLVLSVVPALIGWAATLAVTRSALAILAIAFLTLLLVDLFWASAKRAPEWYGGLRLQLSCAVLVCLAIAWISMV